MHAMQHVENASSVSSEAVEDVNMTRDFARRTFAVTVRGSFPLISIVAEEPG